MSIFEFKPAFKLDDAALDHMLNSPSGDVGGWLRRRGKVMEAAAKRDVGVSTGELRASIYRTHERIPKGQKMVIGARARHALVHHNGSRAHAIIGGVGHQLMFVERGKIVRKKVVHHPGTRPNPYLVRQLKYLLVP